jgi:hypothetical protein
MNSRPPKIKETKFAHPSEEEFARILDFYQIRWEYEPRTFPLKFDSQGNLKEAFSPDFYLVDQDLYVELTTKERRLMTLKRHKLRRLKELFPEINIKMLSRDDFHHLLLKYGLEERESQLIGPYETK